MNNFIYLTLSEQQVESLIDFIEVELLDSIRRDECFDNVDYVVNITTALSQMREDYKIHKERKNELNAVKETAERGVYENLC